MSRSTTTSATAAQTGKAPATPAVPQKAQACVPTEKVAMLAYQKWIKAGCKHGMDKQHWLEAEAELKAEMQKSPAAPARK